MEDTKSNAAPPEPPELPNARPVDNLNKTWVRIVWGSLVALAILIIVVGIFSGGKTQAQSAQDRAIAGGDAAIMSQQVATLPDTAQKIRQLNKQAADVIQDINDKEQRLKNGENIPDPTHMTDADIQRELARNNEDMQKRRHDLQELERKQATATGAATVGGTHQSGSSAPPASEYDRVASSVGGGEVPNLNTKPAPWQDAEATPAREQLDSLEPQNERPHVTTTATQNDAAANSRRRHALDFDPATTKTYYLPAGTIVEGVLKNRLEGEGTGAVLVMVTNDVRDARTGSLYIPAGATVIGTSSSVSNMGQRRLKVTFSRVVVRGLNATYGIPLDSALEGMNQTGAVGLDGKVNTHMVSIFGSAMAVGLIGGLAQIGNGYSGFGYNPSVELRNGFTQGTAQGAMQIMDHFLNRMPTITVTEGKRVRIILIDDVPVPDNKEMERKGM